MSEQRPKDAAPDRRAGTTVADDAARAVLAARLGETVLLGLEDRRYQLTVEMFFRLEELEGAFVYFFRRADALEGRMRQLASGSPPRILAPATGTGLGRDN